jgi:AI-2 transport protein TqsA
LDGITYTGRVAAGTSARRLQLSPHRVGRRCALAAAAWPDRRAEHDRASGFGAAPKQFAGIVAPVLLALILVISFHPLFGILCRRGAPQWLAATITLLALLAVILGMAISLGLSVGRLATILPSYRAQFEQLANELRAWLGSLGVGQDQVNEALKTINFSNVAGLLGDLLAGLAAGLLQPAAAAVVRGRVHGPGLRQVSRRLALARPERPEIVGALDGFVAGTRTYLLVSPIFGLIVAAIDTGFLWLVDVPLPVLWEMLAFHQLHP